MSKFNDEKTDAMLKAYCTREQDTYTFKKPNKLKPTALIAAALVIVLLAGILVIPELYTKNTGNSFVIVVNASSLDGTAASADELNKDTYVEFTEISSNNIMSFDFDEPLYTDAPQYNIVKRYLFHSFVTNLLITVQGENIDTITYKPSQGAFNASYYMGDWEDWPDGFRRENIMCFSYKNAKPELTIDYENQDKLLMSYSPVYDPDDNYKRTTIYYSSPDPIAQLHKTFLDTDEYVYSESYNELYSKYNYAQPLAGGFHTASPSIVLPEEKEALREFAKKDDMIGFFNYQNQIFKRIIDSITIDVTVTFTDGSSQTQTLALMYNPIENNSESWYYDPWYLDNQSNSYSNGTISAKLI